jgi:N-acetyl-anhydromuramyl-L-alanine amidase AmpD
MPSLNTLINGRPDLPGPLCQIGLARDGTCYLVADGRANHAGIGNWHGITMGNSCMIGIEAENTGLPNDSPWPDVQMDAYHRVCAAIAEHLGFSKDAHDTCASDHIAGHREFALPPGRKSDPDFDMAAFRAAVQALIDTPTPAPSLADATGSAEGEVDPSTSADMKD